MQLRLLCSNQVEFVVGPGAVRHRPDLDRVSGRDRPHRRGDSGELSSCRRAVPIISPSLNANVAPTRSFISMCPTIMSTTPPSGGTVIYPPFYCRLRSSRRCRAPLRWPSIGGSGPFSSSRPTGARRTKYTAPTPRGTGVRRTRSRGGGAALRTKATSQRSGASPGGSRNRLMRKAADAASISCSTRTPRLRTSCTSATRCTSTCRCPPRPGRDTGRRG